MCACVLSSQLLRNLKMNPIETLYYISPICLMWMVPAALLTELPTAYRTDSLRLVTEHPFIFCASAIAGCFVNLTSFLLVKRTSSMTLKTLTMARNGGLVIVSAVAMGETITGLEAFGYSGLLVCFACYTWVKATEGRSKAAGETPANAAGTEHELKQLVPSEEEDRRQGDSPPLRGTVPSR